MGFSVFITQTRDVRDRVSGSDGRAAAAARRSSSLVVVAVPKPPIQNSTVAPAEHTCQRDTNEISASGSTTNVERRMNLVSEPRRVSHGKGGKVSSANRDHNAFAHSLSTDHAKTTLSGDSHARHSRCPRTSAGLCAHVTHRQ